MGPKIFNRICNTRCDSWHNSRFVAIVLKLVSIYILKSNLKGLTVLPQALAYATLAGLQPQYGLYSAFVGCIVYAFFGGCVDLTIGPTALLALMTGRHTGLGGESGPHLAILLCFLSGIVEMIMAFLKLGLLNQKFLEEN